MRLPGCRLGFRLEDFILAYCQRQQAKLSLSSIRDFSFSSSAQTSFSLKAIRLVAGPGPVLPYGPVFCVGMLGLVVILWSLFVLLPALWIVASHYGGSVHILQVFHPLNRFYGFSSTPHQSRQNIIGDIFFSVA